MSRSSETEKQMGHAEEKTADEKLADAVKALQTLHFDLGAEATPQELPKLCEAVRALRLALGDTQQQFANRLEMAISTVVRYESTRAPRGEALSKLYHLAVEKGYLRVASMFEMALLAEMGRPVTLARVIDLSLRALKNALVVLEGNPKKEALPIVRNRIETAISFLSIVDPFGKETGREEEKQG
jgi:transcriptional regulator with XRE-family HTH domain